MAAVVHIAGVDIRVGSVMRQRCAWCGEILMERDFSMMATQIQPGESEEQAIEGMMRSRWEPLALVRIDENLSVVVEPEEVPAGEHPKIPEDSCMADREGG